tara:strand:- start:376 stop:624 length:249 start_codon:yes stop_codon:yes gene_type:complete
MKITREMLKKMIKEEVERDKRSEYTPYEQEDLTTDEKMIFLLQEILSQLKVLNLEFTPAKTQTKSAIEKDAAAATVAETEEK